jgi:hypothetical protein
LENLGSYFNFEANHAIVLSGCNFASGTVSKSVYIHIDQFKMALIRVSAQMCTKEGVIEKGMKTYYFLLPESSIVAIVSSGIKSAMNKGKVYHINGEIVLIGKTYYKDFFLTKSAMHLVEPITKTQ